MVSVCQCGLDIRPVVLVGKLCGMSEYVGHVGCRRIDVVGAQRCLQ
jgi:hypothetical protein